ncbi:MAG: hypothetical protein HC896_07790 [Bacteroidales bacterium]|nr:hypothetical protein [Bacteroidales bacterium]
MRYWFSFKGRAWLDEFIMFMAEAHMDPKALSDEQLVYMALLYHAMPKEFTGWHNGTFKMDTKDTADGSLEIYFKLPTTAEGDMGITLAFSSPTENVMIETTTKVNKAAFHPLSAMSLTMPDTNIATVSEQFSYIIPMVLTKAMALTSTLIISSFRPRTP